MDPVTQAAAPPPPPGFVPMNSTAAPSATGVAPASNTPPPPPGFVPMTADASAAAPAAAPAQSPSMWQRLRDKVGSVVANDPYAQMVTGAVKGGMQTVGGALHVLSDPGTDTTPNAQKAPWDLSRDEFHMKQAADWMKQHSNTEGFYQGLGNVGENIAELLGTDGLGEVAGGAKTEAAAGKVAGVAEDLAERAKTASFLNKNPKIAQLVAYGIHAAHAAMQSGGQTFVKTGGDVDAATRAAALGGAASGVIEPLADVAKAGVKALTPEVQMIEGLPVPVKKTTPIAPTPAQAAGAEAYTNTAREAVRPHLQALNDASPNPHMTWDIDDAGNFTQPEAGKVLPKVDVDATLNKVHDFTSASDQLTQANNAIYDSLDQATGGKFRELNGEVQAAKKLAYDGGPEAQAMYANKLKQMQDLMDKGMGGNVTPEAMSAVKAAWRQSYILSDAGNALDKSLDGLPGESNVSMQQRGINGKKLDSGLQRLVQRHGLETVKAALGPGRLENLQTIADATKTNAQRLNFNRGLHEVARFVGGAAGAKAGSALSGGSWEGTMAGAATGAAVGAKAHAALARTLEAVRMNPKVGQNLVFAIESGADPKNYGPFIGAMITKAESENQEEEPR